MFSCEWEPTPLPENNEAVGIDVGLHSFATLSTGEHIENPRFFRQEEKALAKAQRKLSKAEKGTLERKKRRKVVARIHERIAWKRQNFIHQHSRRIINRFGIIAVEDIHVNHMLHNHCLATVSYTHLDVYKRQGHKKIGHFPVLNAPFANIRFPGEI